MRISDWSSDVCSSDLLLILGLSAALQPLAIQMQTLRLELPAIVIASATLLAFAWDGTLSRLEGLVLVTMGVVFTLAVIRAARRESLKVKLEFARAFGHRRLANRQAATELLILASSEERRVGKAGVRQVRTRWVPK